MNAVRLKRKDKAQWEATPANVLAHASRVFDGAESILRLYRRYLGKGVPYEVGRTRITFLFRTYVVKLPWSHDGFADNDWEGSVSNMPETVGDYEHYQYARTRLAYVGDIPVTFMERVEPARFADVDDFFDGEEPWWIACVDCGQVGFTRKGRLVAYDYGVR